MGFFKPDGVMAYTLGGGILTATLKRTLGLGTVTAYGVGVILGAGIYVLVGEAAALAGTGVWVSFLLAAFIAAFTALSYAELSSTFTQNSSEHFYAAKAFSSKWLAFLTGWLILIMGMVSAATIALGFGHYFEVIMGIPAAWAAVGLIAVLSLLNFWGIEESARMNVAFTIIEVLGLLLIIALGLPTITQVPLFSETFAWDGIWAAAALIFFAYVGFEGIVKLGEETKNPHKVLPKALLLSLGITTVIYILLALALLGMMPIEQLANDNAPLVTVVQEKLGIGWLFGLLAWIAISNGVLIMLIVTSRMLYGMAKHHALPHFLSAVHEKRQTPHLAVALTGIVSAALVFVGNIDFIANVANFATFLVFAVVNACVIRLALRSDWNPPFKMPFRLGRIPLLAVVGLLTSLGILMILPLDVIQMGVAFTAIGVVIHFFTRPKFMPRLEAMMPKVKSQPKGKKEVLRKKRTPKRR